MKSKVKIILASASPRRKELLEQIGLDFQVLVSQVEEKISSSIPWQVVEELSSQKAAACAEQLLKTEEQDDVLVIGADTIVASRGQILGKPESPENACEMLKDLQGGTHLVYTGVTLIHCPGGKEKPEKVTFHEQTEVTFYPMTQTEIEEYVATGDPLDKAGAYGIQGLCAKYIKAVKGEYNNVVGLPVARLYQEMKNLLGDEDR